VGEWRIAFGEISVHKFGLNFVGEIEWQTFCQTLCCLPASFCLGNKVFFLLVCPIWLPVFFLIFYYKPEIYVTVAFVAVKKFCKM